MSGDIFSCVPIKDILRDLQTLRKLKKEFPGCWEPSDRGDYEWFHHAIENEEDRDEREALMLKMVSILHDLSFETAVQLDRGVGFSELEGQLVAEIMERASVGASCICSNSSR